MLHVFQTGASESMIAQVDKPASHFWLNSADHKQPCNGQLGNLKYVAAKKYRTRLVST